LIIKLIEMVDKWAIEWMMQQLRMTLFGQAQSAVRVGTEVTAETAKTAATTTGVAARSTAEEAGTAAGLATSIAAAFSSITRSAGQVFTGVFANLSPILGPAAAGPAAASASAAEAGGLALMAADTGTDYIMRSGLAVVHQGEAVVPAQFNTPYTGGGAGGGGDVHNWNISAWDAASVKSWLSGGGDRVLAMSVSKYMNRNPSARPTY
jgi:hypothetical protein